MPALKAAAQQQTSIGVSAIGTTIGAGSDDMSVYPSGGLWEDDEERKFHEDLPDLADFLPKEALGIQSSENTAETAIQEKEKTMAHQDLLDELNRELSELEKNLRSDSQNGPEKESKLEDEKCRLSRAARFFTHCTLQRHFETCQPYSRC